jgi:decaprenylphospho-beta-D-ribofuranose 2-oxidase
MPDKSTQRVRNWGGYPAVQATVATPGRFEDLVLRPGESVIARGNGRCYGDAALHQRIVSTLRWNRLFLFDRQQGLLGCEAGVLLADVLALVMPHGFFLPVTPGTQYITVGGAVAANVHGKNHHHAGAFGQYVDWLELLTETGQRLRCSRTEHPELFRRTIGGMGLTGIITRVQFRLRQVESAYMQVAHHAAGSLPELLHTLEAHRPADYLVAWLDALTPGQALGRGIVQVGAHAPLASLGASERAAPLHLPAGRPWSLPAYLPRHTLNRYSIGLYNALYYRRHCRQPPGVVPFPDFFYPLDKLHHWNRLYGRPGFVQYQLVLPAEAAEPGLTELLRTMQQAGCAAFLAVLKLMGPADEWAAPISFPMAGVSLALDFRLTPAVLALLTRLDAITLHYGGRLYLAKDARMAPAFFQQTYPPFPHPAAFQSCQSQRLGI